MAHARRIDPTPIPFRDSAARLADRRIGGMAVAEYLYDLFAASPLELFSRISVLSVLDHVKKDRDLFPDGAGVGVGSHVPVASSMTGRLVTVKKRHLRCATPPEEPHPAG